MIDDNTQPEIREIYALIEGATRDSRILQSCVESIEDTYRCADIMVALDIINYKFTNVVNELNDLKYGKTTQVDEMKRQYEKLSTEHLAAIHKLACYIRHPIRQRPDDYTQRVAVLFDEYLKTHHACKAHDPSDSARLDDLNAWYDSVKSIVDSSP